MNCGCECKCITFLSTEDEVNRNKLVSYKSVFEFAQVLSYNTQSVAVSRRTVQLGFVQFTEDFG